MYMFLIGQSTVQLTVELGFQRQAHNKGQKKFTINNFFHYN